MTGGTRNATLRLGNHQAAKTFNDNEIFMRPTLSLLILSLFLQRLLGQNLLVNGAFEDGNAGFTSAYMYSPANTVPSGTYAVSSDPRNTHSGAASFKDHTSGHGLMLVANGSTNSADVVFSQIVSVATNRTYVFAGWGTTWGHLPNQDFDPAPPAMRIVINGRQQGGAVQLQSKNGLWQSFTALWDSQSSTQAIIQIRLATTASQGNDIALDDFSLTAITTNEFASITIYRSVEVEWQSVSNHVYQVQWAASIDSDSWFNLGAPTLATGTSTSAWDRVLASEKRFYRVLSLE
jgi:hypothetical protein